MNKTIVVSANATMDFKVDYINMYLDLNKTLNTYEECVNDSKKASSYLSKFVLKLGFNDKDLKLLNFDIQPSFDNKDHTSVVGYRYHQSYKLSFDFDTIFLGKVIDYFQTSEYPILFNLAFSLKNSKSCKDKVLKEAIKEAKNKAKVIASSLGLKIIDIANVEYGSNNHNYERVNSYAKSAMALSDFTPEDISITDKVTITFNVE